MGSAALVLALGACGPTTSESTEQTSTTPTPSESSTSEPTSSETPEHLDKNVIPADKAVQIDVWHTFNDEYTNTIKGIIEKFKDVEPNVTVNLVKQTGSYDQLKDKVVKGFSADNYPDLTIAYPDHVAEYIDYGKSVNLDSFMDNPVYGWTSAEKKDVITNYLDEGQSYSIEGTYSLPFAKSTEAMFYNADVLIGLNLKTEDPTINGGNALDEAYLNDLTWEELFNKLCPAIISYNEKLAADQKILKNDLPHHAVVGYDSDDNLFITLAEQYGYNYTEIDKATGKGKVLFNNPEMKALMKTFNNAYKKHYIVTKASNENNYVNDLFTASNSLFSIGSTGGTKHQYSKDFKTGVAKIPHAEGGDPTVINQGPSLTMLRHGNDDVAKNRQLAAWLFYKFATNTTNTTMWGVNTSYMPVRYSAYTTAVYLDYANPEGKEGDTALLARVAAYNPTVQDDLFTSPVFRGSSACRVQAGSIMYQCLIAETLDDATINNYFATAENNAKKEIK